MDLLMFYLPADLLQVPPVNMGMVSNSILWKSRATGLYSSWFLSRKL